MNTRSLFFTAVIGALSAFSGLAYGQATEGAGAAGGAERGHRLDFLSREDKMHLLRVRRQVLQSDPSLKAEAESLRQDAQSVRNKGSDVTAEDKAALRHRLREHREKMDAAMVKADPTIQPVLDQIKAHLKQRLGQGATADGGDAPDNP